MFLCSETDSPSSLAAHWSLPQRRIRRSSLGQVTVLVPQLPQLRQSGCRLQLPADPINLTRGGPHARGPRSIVCNYAKLFRKKTRILRSGFSAALPRAGLRGTSPGALVHVAMLAPYLGPTVAPIERVARVRRALPDGREQTVSRARCMRLGRVAWVLSKAFEVATAASHDGPPLPSTAAR